MVLSSGKMSMKDLQTYYGLEDLYDMVDLMMVDAHNSRVWAKHHAKKGK
jgi:hypothetical protein